MFKIREFLWNCQGNFSKLEILENTLENSQVEENAGKWWKCKSFSCNENVELIKLWFNSCLS